LRAPAIVRVGETVFMVQTHVVTMQARRRHTSLSFVRLIDDLGEWINLTANNSSAVKSPEAFGV